MSSAKGAATKSGASAAAAAAARNNEQTPAQTSVLLVQIEALDHDDAIRSELKKNGFSITQQALVCLSREKATHFVTHVTKPEIAFVADSESSDTTTPREKMASSRSPRPVAEREEDAVAGLSRGPVLLLVVEKPNAVAELIELVGPAAPESWRAVPSSLRARFGVDAGRVGVRCTTHEAAAAHEMAFLLSHTQTPSAVSPSQRSHRSVASNKSPVVNINHLLDFLFPSHVLHPNSTGRLFVFGLYGPLDSNARLRSGEKGFHVVTDRELDAMSSRMEREDILAVYDMCSLSQEEEEEVLRGVDGALKSFPRYSKRDVETLFSTIARVDVGSLSFHDMQAAIIKERCRRVLCMKERIQPALSPAIQNQFRKTLTRIMKTQDEIAPATMFIKGLGFTGAENATLVSRLLSNHAFQICQMKDGNSLELTQNVGLLREYIHRPRDARAPWNLNV